MQWAIILLLLGVSFTLWATVGIVRFVQQWHSARNRASNGVVMDRRKLFTTDVAVLVPAHNEELTIGATLESASRLVPAGNIHVVADGCDDGTAAIARSHGASVLAFAAARGKAAGIEAAVQHFDLVQRFSVLLILDADTQLDENYIDRGLALLNDPGMGAVAGYAHTTWRPEQLSLVGRFLVSYRTRLYAVMQWIKYGQTWRYTNVTPIIPGFASMYRTNVLSQIDLNPPGLVIEDFNMTFELHRKRLGKVAFEPSVFGRTQDPDNLQDYYRQIRRWWLGFWQTLRRHGLWLSWFSAALCVFLVEIMIASLVLIFTALAIILLAVGSLSGGLALEMTWYTSIRDILSGILTPVNLLLFLFVPDYILTCAVAIWMRRPSLLVYGMGFLFIRLLDSTAALWTLQQTWRTKSTGRWSSPRRRTVEVPTMHDGTLAAAAGEPASVVSPAATAEPVAAGSQPSSRRRRVNPVVHDALLVVTLLGMVAGTVAIAVPLAVALTAGVLVLTISVIWSYRSQGQP